MSDTAESILRALIAATSVLAAAYLGFALLQWVARRYSDRHPGLLSPVDKSRRPFGFLVGLVVAHVVSARIAHLKDGWIETFQHGLQIATIVALVWLAVTIVSAIEDQILKNDLKRERSAVDRRRFE